MASTLPAINFYNPASDLYTRAISSTYKYGIRIYDPDFGLARDPDLFEKLMRDPEIKSAMELRLHKVAAKDWTIVPASDEMIDKTLASVVKDGFQRIQRFAMTRYELAKAIFQARAYQFVNCEDVFASLGGMTAQTWSLPISCKDIDKKRFDYVPVNEANRDMKAGGQDKLKAPGGVSDSGTDISVYERLWSVSRSQWEQVVRPEFFIRMVYDDEESRLGYGRGLSEALFFFWRFKCIALEQGMAGLERWAQGLLIASIEDTRVGSTDKSNEEIRDAYMAILKQMRSQHTMAISNKDKIEVLEPTGQGNTLVLEMLRYFDEAMCKVILGSIRPTGGGIGGSLARTEEESETTESLIQYDRMQLDDVLSRDLIGLFMLRNKFQLASLGLANARAPQFRTGSEKRKNAKESMEVITAALAAGIKIKAEEAYEKIDMTMPSEGDEILVAQAPAAPLNPDGTTAEPGVPGAPGEGKAAEKGLTEDKADPEQLAKGTKTEAEHTANPEAAEKIAMDHLAEDPAYYTKLQKAKL